MQFDPGSRSLLSRYDLDRFPGEREPIATWLRSQNGLVLLAPQRQSRVDTSRATTRPVPLVISRLPRTSSGPFGSGFTSNKPSRTGNISVRLVRGPHDENDDELQPTLNGFGPRSNAYTDSIRGCEALCFGTIKTACSCAACFETDACDSKCSELDSCLVRDPMGKATMSEAVGALCRDPANVPADMKKSTWHSTMMDCESSCAFGAAQCKSYSLSCDDSCQ